ncbi:hypothetical protein BDV59DRAFT_171310 [Aspergillus ambiguus]|uniref:uncharacterized protein n=1 Tax=Aspergillus ambiguus TaxID=176160 RepID=UPI003CCD26A7
MQFKTLSFLLLASAAMADLDSIATQTDFAGLTSGFAVPTLNIPTPPPSIVSVLATAVPDSFYSTLQNPAARESLIHSIEDGDYPQWYKDLPGNVKTWLSTAYATGAAATDAATTTGGGSSSPTGASSSAAAGSSTSEGVAAPTGAVAMGLMGAAGVLGLAIAL